MALSTGMCAEVRSGGSDTNGGCFRGGSNLAAPAAPALTAFTTSGSISANTYYVCVKLTNQFGDTELSAESSITTTGATSRIQVTSPTGSDWQTWSAFLGTTSGGPYFPIVAMQGVARGTDGITSAAPTTGVQPAGTDYTQQDAAEHAYTDIAIDAVTSTLITSAVSPFTPRDVGNVINITGGSGFTAGRYEITGCTSAGVATVDRAIGTVGSTGGTGNFGGALASLGGAGTAVSNVTTFKVWIRAGTYSVSTSNNITGGRFSSSASGSDSSPSYIRGYQTTRGDLTGTRPLLQMSMGGVNAITPSGAYIRIENLEFDPNAFTGHSYCAMTGIQGAVRYCKFGSATNQISMTGAGGLIEYNEFMTIPAACNGSIIAATGIVVRYNTYRDYNNGTAIQTSVASSAQIYGNRFYNFSAGGTPITVSTNSRLVCVRNNSIQTTAQVAIDCGPLCEVENNVIVYNSNSLPAIKAGTINNGITVGGVRNNFVFNSGTHPDAVALYLANQSGNVKLTADPFTDAVNGDMTLNSTVGGGADCKGAGFPDVYPVYPSGSYTNSFDAGAHQSAGSGGGGGGGGGRQGLHAIESGAV